MHTLRLPLIVNNNTKPILEKRFRILSHISNQIRKHVKKLLSRLDNDKEYQELLEEYRRLNKVESKDKNTIAEIKRISNLLNETREGIGLSKNKLEEYARVMQKRYKKNIATHQVQAEVKHIWKGVEIVLFGNGKDVHYKKSVDFHTMPGKSNTNGAIIHFDENPDTHKTDCYITWNKLHIPVKYDTSKPDMPDGRNYINESLAAGKIKYCEIVRLWFKSGWKYYVNIYIDGNAPKKLTPGKSVMGIDEGVSTVAAVSEDAVFLEELAPKCKDYNRKIADLQRKIDRSTRQSNPERYNEDGTCKRKSKDLPAWKFSNTCKRNRAELRELYRKKSEYTKCQHENLLNRMVSNASVFVNEPMEFKALAKKAKETKRQDKPSTVKKSDGTEQVVYKYKRKKRFGKSVNDRSPALLKTRLEQKCVQYDLEYIETDKWKYRASQYNHIDDEYIKAALSERFKLIGGVLVQRDLYSAFLQSCFGTIEKPDRNKCIQMFDNFVKMQNALITEMKASGKSYPACFGF